MTRTTYKEKFLSCLDAIEYTLSSHGNEDWLRSWVEGDEEAENDLQKWKDQGRPQ
jgi:hypothetical protein